MKLKLGTDLGQEDNFSIGVKEPERIFGELKKVNEQKGLVHLSVDTPALQNNQHIGSWDISGAL